jgi:transcriptional regulator with XRE-family HTH domain
MKDDKQFQREELIYNVTEDILILMEDKNISKNELSRSLNKSKSYVSQVLSGNRNMTLATLSDICFALKIKPIINIPIGGARNLLEESTFVGEPIRKAAKVYQFPEKEFLPIKKSNNTNSLRTPRAVDKITGQKDYGCWAEEM